MNMKSPVSILHDFLNKTGIIPVYELRSEKVTRRAILFHYRLKVGDSQATATGFTKKQAKQNVSEKMLETLFLQCPKLFKSVTKTEKKCLDDVTKLHPVQSLYDICVSNYWYIPMYEYVTQEGPANDRTFTCVAIVNDIKEKGIGIGRSKKLSKSNAAFNLVEKLITQNRNSFDYLISHSNMNYITALRDMANRNDLRLNFFHLTDRENCAQKQCLLEILSNPVIVCCGFGETGEDALNDASMNAMNSFKILKKNSPSMYYTDTMHRSV